MQKIDNLSTDRVYLKELKKEDYSLFLELDSDVEVMKYLTDGRPSTEQEAKDAINRVLKIQKETHNVFGLWFAYLKDSDEYIGWFLFRPDKADPLNFKKIEIGYRLKKKIWGQGIASEVSKSLLKFGFENLALDEVFAITMEENLGSQRVMQKIGLSFETQYIEDIFPGENKNAVRFHITKEMWNRGSTNQQL